MTSNPGAVPHDGQWHYLVGVDSGGSTGHVYVDGVNRDAVTDNTQPISTMPNNALVMAKVGADVDELAIYPTALSAARIQAHYNAGRVDKAIRLFEEALRLMDKVLGREHPHALVVRNNLAVMVLSAATLSWE